MQDGTNRFHPNMGRRDGGGHMVDWVFANGHGAAGRTMVLGETTWDGV